MNTLSRWEIATGSVAGTEHRRVARNSQDAFCFGCGPDSIVGVVCDGCSGGIHSEVGAWLAAPMLVNLLSMQGSVNGLLAQARIALLDRITAVAESIRNPKSEIRNVLLDYFLFTIVGFVVTEQTTAVFSIGDGLFALNGEKRIIAAETPNEPTYAAYELLGGGDCAFHIHSLMPTDEVDSILIGTDGANDIEDLGEFWQRDLYFSNADAIRRRLEIQNRKGTTPLADDTTVIVLRRRGTAAQAATADWERGGV